MIQTKPDSGIVTFIKNGIKLHHRTMFVIVGNNGRDQVATLSNILTKSMVKVQWPVLWCYKNELGFSTNKKKKYEKVLKKKFRDGRINQQEFDSFDSFIASTKIRYCKYSMTETILGCTFSVCVLQDFEALTPNLLARTIETVVGGGLIILLLPTIKSLKEVYNMAMDVHERYRTEAHRDIVPRFNERFILSLASCDRCLVVDSNLNVLPSSSHVYNENTVSVKDAVSDDSELKKLIEDFRDTQPVGSIVACCKTNDQAKSVLKFIDAISENTLKFTVSLTAARGRGKSAALGLAVSAAVAFGYTNIFVTSPSPENLKTFFEFVVNGLEALGYKNTDDFVLIESTNPEFKKAIIRVNIFKNNRQTIQYIHPTDSNKLSHAELLVIDEAAAIPLPLVKKMFGPYLIFLSSTINGYEGTGRSLSLKLLQELRTQSNSKADLTKSSTRTLYEITLEESIRYESGDSVEEWLTELLCLNASNVPPLVCGTPAPSECELYYVNRDTLFSYHKDSETFLQSLVALYVSSHYKNSPNDLQLLSDAPAHHIFCLLGPVNKNKKDIPDILCVIQVCLEGQLTTKHVLDTFSNGRKPTGDLIPWTIGQQFLDTNFPTLCGVRVVRIATHPDYQSMGYGSRALQLLTHYYSVYNGAFNDIDETIDNEIEQAGDEDAIEPRKNLPPLLVELSERKPERVEYIGVSYGLTSPLLKFWKKSGYTPVYIRQTPNELTGEYSCIMIKQLTDENDSSWLRVYWGDFCRRFSSLLSYQFRELPTSLALSVINNKNVKSPSITLTKNILDCHLTKYDLKRLDKYCGNLIDYHLIMDLLPTISKLYFNGYFSDVKCPAIQSAILLGIGLQHKKVDDLTVELDLPVGQILGIFNRTIRKIQQALNSVTESATEESLGFNNKQQTALKNDVEMVGLQQEMDADNRSLKRKHKKEFDILQKEFLQEYAIQGTDDDWNKALSSGHNKTISIKMATQEMKSDSSVLVENKKYIHKKKKMKVSHK